MVKIMNVRKVSPSQRRIQEHRDFLEMLTEREVPWECTSPSAIEMLVSLAGASLVIAQFDQPIYARTGASHIPRAIVTAITAEGRKLLRKGGLATSSLF